MTGTRSSPGVIPPVFAHHPSSLPPLGLDDKQAEALAQKKRKR